MRPLVQMIRKGYQVPTVPAGAAARGMSGDHLHLHHAELRVVHPLTRKPARADAPLLTHPFSLVAERRLIPLRLPLGVNPGQGLPALRLARRGLRVWSQHAAHAAPCSSRSITTCTRLCKARRRRSARASASAANPLSRTVTPCRSANTYHLPPIRLT